MPTPVATAPSSLYRSYHVVTWGCQMNDEDSEQMALGLEQLGLTAAPDVEHADVVILNTCSVRQKPVDKAYSKLGELRELQQERPHLVVGVCGCMAQVESVELRRRAPFVDIVLGTGNLGALPHLVQEAISRRSLPRDGGAGADLTEISLPPRTGQTVTDVPLRNIRRRAKLKAHVPIMYGCDKFCAFCIVPFTRGRERSRPTSEILAEIEGLARGGTREVTLLGQTVNSYGKNLLEGRVPFADLLRRVGAVRGIERIRFTSPYPKDFSGDLIKAISEVRAVCEHVHLPLQVGDDSLLAAMRRGYTVDDFRRILWELREAVPGIAVTTDIMLGFPGETDEAFRNTLTFVQECQFDSAFMFAYSVREGTRAAEMGNQVPQSVRIERLKELIDLQNRITCEINEAQAGRVFEVLVEGASPKNPLKVTGLTRTMKTVNFDGDLRLIGRLVDVRAVKSHLWGFQGESVEERLPLSQRLPATVS